MTSEIMHLWAKVIFRAGMPEHCLGIEKKTNNNFHEKQQIKKIKPFEY